MKFFLDNVYNGLFLAVALVSGFLLVFPMLQRRGQKVTTLQATQLMNTGKVVLLDVRSAAEFADGHVRDAKNIPLKELDSRITELDKFKAKSVVAMCQSGVQSARATTQLKAAGFADVYSLDGGVAAWRTQGLPLTK